MIDQHFAIPIYHSYVGEPYKEKIQKEIDSVSVEINQFLNNDCWDYEIDSTYRDISSIIEYFNLNKLSDVILDHTTVFLNEVSTKHFNFYVSQSWLNNGVPGSFQYEHKHVFLPHNNEQNIIPCISGVYYISVPENSGDIRFINPWQLAFYNKLTVQKSSCSYTPNDGELLLFPSNLPHRVGINKSNKNRLSISFNIVCESLS